MTDNLGSVRNLINSSGALVDHIVYNSFGKIASETDPSTGFLFAYTGSVVDHQTGLQYSHRYYDPSLGRFISQDPLSFGAGDPNLYRYVGTIPRT